MVEKGDGGGDGPSTGSGTVGGQNRSSPDSKGPPFDRPLDATLRVQELSGRKELGGAVQTLKQVQGDGLRSG